VTPVGWMVVKAIVVVKDEDGTGEVLKWVTTLRNHFRGYEIVAKLWNLLNVRGWVTLWLTAASGLSTIYSKHAKVKKNSEDSIRMVYIYTCVSSITQCQYCCLLVLKLWVALDLALGLINFSFLQKNLLICACILFSYFICMKFTIVRVSWCPTVSRVHCQILLPSNTCPPSSFVLRHLCKYSCCLKSPRLQVFAVYLRACRHLEI